MINTNNFHTSSVLDHQINDSSKNVKNCTENHKLSSIKSKNFLLLALNKKKTMKNLNKTSSRLYMGKKYLRNTKSTKKLSQSTSSNLKSILNKNKTCSLCGEMLSSDECSSMSIRNRSNSSLSTDDILNNLYYCQDCRQINDSETTRINQYDQQKLIKPLKITSSHTSKYEQIKVSTVSNSQTILARLNNDDVLSPDFLSTSLNLKRKRTDSLSTTTSNTHLDILHNLFVSQPTEQFHGPSFSSNNSILHHDNHIQKSCFICQNALFNQNPSIQCQYCPLTYHLECLAVSIKPLPSSNEKWMCPNHMQSVLDRCLSKATTDSRNERFKYYPQRTKREQNIIKQELICLDSTKTSLLPSTAMNHRLEKVNISEIPMSIRELYSPDNFQKRIDNDQEESNESNVQHTILFDEYTSTYNPCVWDVLQDIVNHIINKKTYEFSSTIDLNVKNDCPIEPLSNNQYYTLNNIEQLLVRLHEPGSPDAKVNNVDFRTNQIQGNNQISQAKLQQNFSILTDLSQFCSSHAALIHLASQHVIYIRKHVIWFGSVSSNDVCLKNLDYPYNCPYVSERHACLYYDRKHNSFELLNYSEYGTIVNDLCYGFQNSAHDDIKYDNENIQKCNCRIKSSLYSSWDGSAHIEQGTVIKIGCHEFLFYRYINR